MLRIISLKAIKVNGYIPINLTFNPTLTFLTGANGCGKTTALKLVSAVLEPNFTLLNDIEFDNLILRIKHYENDIIISLFQSSENDLRFLEYTIEVFGQQNNSNLQPVSGRFQLFGDALSKNYSTDEINKLKEPITVAFIQSDYHVFIQAITNPMILGIDRKPPTTVSNEASRLRRRYLSPSRLLGPTNSSFADAQRVIFDYVSEKAEFRRGLVESFKANMFRTIFSYLPHDRPGMFKPLTDSELQAKLATTLGAIKRLELVTQISEDATRYFAQLGGMQEKIADAPAKIPLDSNVMMEWWANRPHLARIDQISGYAQEFQNKIDDLDRPLIKITDLVNDFFKESNKSIKIGANGAINVFRHGKALAPKNLSSGEIQLVVIIIHLVFSEYDNSNTVFVIDEPELSLHISWQEKFVRAITLASPSTQFILATHSPAIISTYENEQYCIYMNQDQ